IVNVLAGSAADKMAARFGVFQARVSFAVCGFVGATAVLLLLVIPNRDWVLPVLVFSMCATGIGNSNYWAISQHVPPKYMVGRTIGFLNTVSQIAGVVAPIVTGWLLGPQKQFGTAILVAGVTPLLAAVCLLAAGASGLDRLKALLAGSPQAGA
ncbi:MAG: MFS transporter, partial [Bryobacteraceae bacterium]